jgi:hypothetical protein
MRRLKFILPLVLLFAINGQAQLIIGYTAGHTGLRDLNREIYVYNQINAHQLDKSMHELHWFQGPVVGFRTPGNVYFELTYNRKKASTRSVFTDTASGTEFNRQIKVYCNTYNFGVGFRADGWSFGGSMDFGRFKGFGRRGPGSSIKDTAWTRLFVVERTRIIGISVRLYFAATFWVERTVGIATIRLYTQPLAFKQPMDGLDSWFFPNRYATDPAGHGDMDFGAPNEEHFLNSGISIFLNIGGN